MVLLVSIVFIVLLVHTLDEGEVQRKRIFSNKVTGEIWRVLQHNEDCVLNFKNLCPSFTFDIDGILIVRSSDVVTYKNNTYGYEVDFIKKSNFWKCHSPPGGYHIPSC
jgi:uncharacterized protein YvpB